MARINPSSWEVHSSLGSSQNPHPFPPASVNDLRFHGGLERTKCIQHILNRVRVPCLTGALSDHDSYGLALSTYEEKPLCLVPL